MTMASGTGETAGTTFPPASPELRAAKPYLCAEELAELTPFTEEAIRTMVKRKELMEGIHYFRVGRRIVFKWLAVVEFIEKPCSQNISLLRGGSLGGSERS